MYRAAAAAASSFRSSTSRNLVKACGRVVSSRNYVAKDINFGIGARAAMLAGVDELAEAVKVTMGPKGRNVIIEKHRRNPQVTKDGVTVAKSINFLDKSKNIGADLVKQVAEATNKVAGDGTTCATVLTQAIFKEGCKSVAAGVNVMDLRKGINMAVDAVIADLKSSALMISTSDEITQNMLKRVREIAKEIPVKEITFGNSVYVDDLDWLKSTAVIVLSYTTSVLNIEGFRMLHLKAFLVATISANGESEIGEMIAQAMEKVGKEGVITVVDGNTMYNELEVVEGMKLARGYISPYFVTDEKTKKCELGNPLILIHEKKISDMEALSRILELVVKRNRPLLIVAEDVESESLTMLVLNKHHAGLKICAIKAPGFGDNRRANLEDLAILTGGEIISEEYGTSLNKVQIDMLGSAKKVTVSVDDTLILHGGGDKKLIEERCEQLRTSYENSTAVFDKEKAQERLSKLSGGVAVFKVGGASEAEVGERKDRVTDALNATRAAVEEGIVPGGGIALLYATRVLKDLQTANEDQKRGVEIIKNALKAPTFTIASNAGVDGALVLGKLLEQDDLNLGYDAASGEYVNMVKAGIIDPVKVIRTALLDAASVSILLTTTETAVVDSQGEKNPLRNRMPNMDDMEY